MAEFSINLGEKINEITLVCYFAFVQKVHKTLKIICLLFLLLFLLRSFHVKNIVVLKSRTFVRLGLPE